MEEADKGWLMIRIGVNGWIFLLVPAHLGSTEQKAVKQLLLLCIKLLRCSCSKGMHFFNTKQNSVQLLDINVRYIKSSWVEKSERWVTVAETGQRTDRQQAVESRMQSVTCVRQKFQSVPPMTRLWNMIFISVTGSIYDSHRLTVHCDDWLITSTCPSLCESPAHRSHQLHHVTPYFTLGRLCWHVISCCCVFVCPIHPLKVSVIIKRLTYSWITLHSQCSV